MGSEKSVIEELKKLENVKEVQGTLGAYDIVATVESEKPEGIRQTIIGKIRNIEHIRSTLTLMGMKGVEPDMSMAELIPDIIPREKRPLEPPTGKNEDEEFEDEDYDDEDYEEEKNN